MLRIEETAQYQEPEGQNYGRLDHTSDPHYGCEMSKILQKLSKIP